MFFQGGISRRGVIKAGMAGLSASLFPCSRGITGGKKPGEVRVLFLVGDYWHNPVTQEKNWRNVLHPTGWRLMFAQAARFVTPELLSGVDLFVAARYAKTNSLGWSPRGIVEVREDEEPFLTDERERAIIENVRRGMGFLAMHCTIWNGERKRFMDLLGVAEPHMHTKVQPAFLHELNPNHPVTSGVEPAELGEDEIFSADLLPERSVPLFRLKGEEQPIDTLGGWCHEYGKGRVVVLLPGHTPHPFHSGSFKRIMWNAAHWAMGREIPPREFRNGRPPEKTLYRTN